MPKQLFRSIQRHLVRWGINPLRAARCVRGVPNYIADFVRLRKQRPPEDTSFPFGPLFPCFGDRFAGSGSACGHYFHQDLLIASRIFEKEPERHVDVGSRIDGFVAHVASFRKITVLDIRPLRSEVRNVDFLQVDLMSDLPASLVCFCDSLSCLHALEHFGLGRYGDPVRWDGYRVGFNNLVTMLKPGGTFYFSVPIGEQRIEFNAHRVFSMTFLLRMFAGCLRIDDFSFVDDRGDLHEKVELDEQAIRSNCGCLFGCGIFELRKI